MPPCSLKSSKQTSPVTHLRVVHRARHKTMVIKAPPASPNGLSSLLSCVAKMGKDGPCVHQKMPSNSDSSHLLEMAPICISILLLLFCQHSGDFLLQKDNIPSTLVYSLENFALCTSGIGLKVKGISTEEVQFLIMCLGYLVFVGSRLFFLKLNMP